MWRFLRRVLSSRVGLALTAAHLCLVLLDFYGKSVQDFDPQNCTSVSEWDVTGYLIAGRFFHFSYETTLHKLTMLADLPALVPASLFIAPVYYVFPRTCAYTASWITAFVFLAFASSQWLLVGYGIERLFMKREGGLQ